MAIVELFDATKWISSHLKGGAGIHPHTMGAFGSFARMWLLFEAVLCRGGASEHEFVRIARAIPRAGAPASTRAAVQDQQRFWAERFPDVTGRCAGLLGDTPAAGRHYEAPAATAALVLMLSAQRIQQTMFYDVKTVDAINEQLEHLDIASQSLAAVFLMARPDIVVPAGRRAAGR